MEQSLQYSMAWVSSQPSHITLLGSTGALLRGSEAESKEEYGEKAAAAAAAASTEETKGFAGKNEAVEVEVEATLEAILEGILEGTVEAILGGSVERAAGISKTARQRGHLKGAWPLRR